MKENCREKIRKICLEDLPRWGNGTNKGRINWKNSINHEVDFQYNTIKGKIKIVDYDGKYLYIKYLNQEPYKIFTGTFTNCELGKFLGTITNEFKIEIGTHYKDNKRDLIIIDREYRKDKDGYNFKWYKYICNRCGYEGFTTEGSIITSGCGCPVCCTPSRLVVNGINSITDTDPWMVKFFANPEEAKLYTSQSNQKIKVKCPDCGKEKDVKICDMYQNKSIFCICSDKQPYPEKFMFGVLRRLNIKVITQLSKTTFKWCEDKRYDFYFKYNNNEEYIVETHGLQHYEDAWDKLEKTQKNDRLKKELALSNGIKEENYIIIDCRDSKMEWIKNNISISKLNELFNLDIIDWYKVEEFALSNRVKEICELKCDKPEMTTTNIAEITGLSNTTIKRYLTKGSKIWDWVNYDVKKELEKSYFKKGQKAHNSKQVEIFKDGVSLGIFESCGSLEKQSMDIFGVKLDNRHIADVCHKRRLTHKGFTFKYV